MSVAAHRYQCVNSETFKSILRNLMDKYGTINDTNKTVIISPELTFSELQKLCGLFNLLPLFASD